MPSYYLNQRSYIVNWTLRNKLPWNLNRHATIFIQENAFENIVCKKWRPSCLGLNVSTFASISIVSCGGDTHDMGQPVYMVHFMSCHMVMFRADSKLAPNQWETSLQCNAASHWLGANLESTLMLLWVPERYVSMETLSTTSVWYQILEIIGCHFLKLLAAWSQFRAVNIKSNESCRIFYKKPVSGSIAQILAYLVHNMSRFHLYLGFGHFGWLPSFFGQ